MLWCEIRANAPMQAVVCTLYAIMNCVLHTLQGQSYFVSGTMQFMGWTMFRNENEVRK
jgi:hypothetical protein